MKTNKICSRPLIQPKKPKIRNGNILSNLFFNIELVQINIQIRFSCRATCHCVAGRPCSAT